ncbi:MAG: hypothetical protein R2863_05620 [Candidatus Kapaibacterium sp.]|nr:hypothetical protein [Ignavibacteriota bacterium]MCB9221926.1 hypothetical protein [Ignavibacteria bacterium]
MSFNFNNEDVEKISETLGVNHKGTSDTWTWTLKNSETNQSVVFTIYNKTKISPQIDETGVLVSVQTKHGYFELHGLTGFLLFEPDEVIFVRAEEEKVSCLVIGSNSSCSLFSNIDKAILKSNITELDPAILLAAMQLSLAESIL